MCERKRLRCVGVEESLQDLSGLAAAGVVGDCEDGYFKIVCEPCGKFVGITGLDIFGNGYENVVASILR